MILNELYTLVPEGADSPVVGRVTTLLKRDGSMAVLEWGEGKAALRYEHEVTRAPEGLRVGDSISAPLDEPGAWVKKGLDNNNK